MAITFPTGQYDGATWTYPVTNVEYTYNLSENSWTVYGDKDIPAAISSVDLINENNNPGERFNDEAFKVDVQCGIDNTEPISYEVSAKVVGELANNVDSRIVSTSTTSIEYQKYCALTGSPSGLTNPQLAFDGNLSTCMSDPGTSGAEINFRPPGGIKWRNKLEIVMGNAGNYGPGAKITLDGVVVHQVDGISGPNTLAGQEGTYGPDARYKSRYVNTVPGRFDHMLLGPSQSGSHGTTFHAILVDDEILINGARPTITLADATEAAKYAEGDSIIEIKPDGTQDDGVAVIYEINGAELTLDKVQGTFNSGNYIRKYEIVAGVTKYLVLDNSGNVVSPYLSDTKQFTPIKSGNINETFYVTFPDLFYTGVTPDDALKPGATLQVEVKATNVAGGDTKESNIIAPDGTRRGYKPLKADSQRDVILYYDIIDTFDKFDENFSVDVELNFESLVNLGFSEKEAQYLVQINT